MRQEKRTETITYIVDESYRIQYMSKALMKQFSDFEPGEICYEKFRGREKPCRNCPLAHPNRKTDLFYNEDQGKWLKINAGEVEWPRARNCHVILAKDIYEEDMDNLCRFVNMKKEILERRNPGKTEKNKLTGLFARNPFFTQTETFLRVNETAAGKYCLVAIDIEHFKLFNEWYGQVAGDKLLREIGAHLNKMRQEFGGIAGYMGGDDFVIVLPNDEKVLENLKCRITGFVRAYGGHTGFLPAFGFYVIDDISLSASQMYDRAILAQETVKGNYAVRCAYYSSDMKTRLENNHVLLAEVQAGLERDEFIYYLQPKCNLNTGKIVGLESLVRWKHPEKGIVAPGYFIPVMESNGLITELDMKVWEQVCQTLQDWIKSGHKVIPISVNVSSVDIYAIDVVEHFKNLVRKYGLPPEYVELEITESAYVEEYKVITGVAEALRNAGFTVLMDDFGSGYSSLNMLKDVNVDVLKIDMKFLKMDENTMDKGMGILEAVTRMANIMGLRMIAEGVETEDQINYLLNMGCIYGQGYFFYKPLPVEEIKILLNDENNVDYRGIQARKIEHVRFKDLFQSELASDSILNNILGPIAIYDVYCDNVELLQVNDKYCLLVGQDPVDLAENVQVMEAIHPEDRKKMQNIFQRSFQRLAEGAEGTVRRRREDGQYIWINIKAFFLREQDGHKMFYGAVRDVSEEMNQFQKLMFYQNRGN